MRAVGPQGTQCRFDLVERMQVAGLQEIAFELKFSCANSSGVPSRVPSVQIVENPASAGDDAAATSLGPKLAADWSLATALAFLAWFVFAPQCISTIAVTRRETNGWKWPIFMVSYLFALAYAAAGITYWTARSFGL